MPAIYAHDRFGRDVFAHTEGQIKDVIATHYTQFEIGLQGPDIFFFYGYHIPNKVVRFGEHLHRVSALPLFSHALQVVRSYGTESAQYAYWLGFICHFALDSECHPYIAEMIRKTGVQHMEIEEEFEKLLLRKDSRDPFTYPLGDLVPTDEKTARAIQPFFPVKASEKKSRVIWLKSMPLRRDPDLEKRDGIYYFSIKAIREALIGMQRIKRFFTVSHPLKRRIINRVMKLIGIYPYLNGVMHQKKDNPKCAETNEGLWTRYQGAMEIAVELMENFDDSVKTGSELSTRFIRTFS